MADNCKITNVCRFVFFHKRKGEKITRLNPVCGVALTASKSMEHPAIRKRIRVNKSLLSSVLRAVAKANTSCFPRCNFCRLTSPTGSDVSDCMLLCARLTFRTISAKTLS